MRAETVIHFVVGLLVSTCVFKPFDTTKRPEKLHEPAKVGEVRELDGIYKIDNEKYGGVVVVRKTVEAYFFQYTTSSLEGGKLASTYSTGVGLRSGDTVAVSWAADDGGRLVRGITIYTLRGKNLEGRWVGFPGGRAQEEKLIFLSQIE